MNHPCIKINPEIIGSEIISIKKEEDATIIEIKISGSMNSHYIPSVIVFCEDNLATRIISNSIPRNSPTSYKFIANGSWKNIITSLAGTLIYSDTLTETGSTKILSIIGVIDGDISEGEIDEAIENCYKGDYLPEHLTKIKKRIKDHIVSFSLPQELKEKKDITGKPELYLKTMLEEIDKNKILAILGDRMKELQLYEREARKTSTPKPDIEMLLLEREVDDSLKMISISKELTEGFFNVRNRKGICKKNYHSYFKKPEPKLKAGVFSASSDFHTHTLFKVIGMIKKFNRTRWDEYTHPVINLLEKAAREQRERFSHHTFNNNVLD